MHSYEIFEQQQYSKKQLNMLKKSIIKLFIDLSKLEITCITYFINTNSLRDSLSIPENLTFYQKRFYKKKHKAITYLPWEFCVKYHLTTYLSFLEKTNTKGFVTYESQEDLDYAFVKLYAKSKKSLNINKLLFGVRLLTKNSNNYCLFLADVLSYLSFQKLRYKNAKSEIPEKLIFSQQDINDLLGIFNVEIINLTSVCLEAVKQKKPV